MKTSHQAVSVCKPAHLDWLEELCPPAPKHWGKGVYQKHEWSLFLWFVSWHKCILDRRYHELPNCRSMAKTLIGQLEILTEWRCLHLPHMNLGCSELHLAHGRKIQLSLLRLKIALYFPKKFLQKPLGGSKYQIFPDFRQVRQFSFLANDWSHTWEDIKHYRKEILCPWISKKGRR